MKLRIHHALFGAFLAVVGILVVLVALLVGQGLRRELLALQQEELARELELARGWLESFGQGDPDRLATELSGRSGVRVTLIAPDGTVLGDSDVAGDRLAALDDHRDRPEVIAALEGRAGFASRASASVGVSLLYGAVPATLDGRTVILRLALPLERVEASVDRIRSTVAGAGVLALLVSMAVAYLLSRALARPLVELADRAGALAAGDFARRVPRLTFVGELDELGAAFNRLADELQARLAEQARERDETEALIDTLAEGVVALTEDARILRTNRPARELLHLPEGALYAPVGTVVRHPELRDLLEASVVRPVPAAEVSLGERQLIVSSRLLERGGAVTTFLDVTELRRLEQVRRDFVANVSHELKTPLTAVRGFAETLLEGEPPPDLRRRFLESIRANTLRLQRTVDDLLDLSRLESGGWVADLGPVDVAEVAREAWKELRDRAEAAGLAFHVRGEEVALADQQALYQVFRNLLDNAVRHTPAGSVSVIVTPEEDRVRVTVADTGTGIPSRALPRIFERFYRADPARARSEGGTGLGLAIVRHLVTAMGGDVSAESELGKGTQVRFVLRRAKEKETEG